MTYPNGQWPRGELAVIPNGTKMGGSALVRRELLPSIVAMQTACYRDTGLVLRPTSAADGYRDKPTQHSTFMGRYALRASGDGPFSDVRFYDHDGDGAKSRFVRLSPAGSAAVPGTSNHGDAEAVDWADMTGRLLAWMRANAANYGWANPAWARDDNPRNGSIEPWHWEPTAPAFAVNKWVDMIGRPDLLAPDGRLPDPLEDDMSAAAEKQIAELHGALFGQDDRGLQTLAARIKQVHEQTVGTGQTSLPHAVDMLAGLPQVVGDNVWLGKRISRRGDNDQAPIDDVADAASRAREVRDEVRELRAIVDRLAQKIEGA